MLGRFTAQHGALSSLPAGPPGARLAWMRGLAVCAIALSLSATVLAGTGPGPGGGSATAIEGVVSDPSGAVVPGATVEIQNPVSQLDRKATTDGDGHFSFANVPVIRISLAPLVSRMTRRPSSWVAPRPV